MNHRLRSLSAASALGLSLTLSALGALAQTPASAAQPAPTSSPGAGDSGFESERAEARARLATARDLFERGSYDGALAEFERLYELLRGSPQQARVLFNIAQCQEQLGRYDEALANYRRYLQEMGDRATNRDEVQGMLRALENFLGVLRVGSNVRGAEVWVDNRRVGTAPGDVRVPGGRHTVQLRASGYLPAQQEVQLTGRATRALTFALERIPEVHGLPPVYFWTAVGATGAALVVGAVFGVSALVADSDAEARLNDPAQRYTVTEETRSDVRSTALVADVLYGTAAAFGVAAGVIFAFTEFHRGGRPAEAARPTVSLSPGSAHAPAASPVGGTF
ncbi:MAG: PEGA domain-containing protein [Deltaproteobacteria bacterium]|nr:PEGA domain-containing protein [Deltaproteobacteria bacterium]